MIYPVVRGDSLWKISRKFNVTVANLMEWNKLMSTTIYPGQKLIVSDTTSTAPAALSLFQFKAYTKKYGLRPVRIFVCKFPIDKVQAQVLYGIPGKLERTSLVAKAWGAELAVNCSFFSGGTPIGRHISNYKEVPSYSANRPTIVLDDWSFVSRLDKSGSGVRDCFSSYPSLIVQGSIKLSDHSSSLAKLNPRTAIGKTNDNHLVVLVADGRRSGYSLGLTMKELANEMMWYGCREWAINLDGGGSSIFIFGGKI